MRIQKINGIGNMISIEDQKNAILDVMLRCTEGSDVYNTYDAIVTMLESLSVEYDAKIMTDNLMDEVFNFSKN